MQGNILVAFFFFLSLAIVLSAYTWLTETNQGKEIMIGIGEWLLKKWPILRKLT
jgi:hypothetical protein